MTSMEKRRSSRKTGGHRKHSDGGFSDTSSGGSFLDETDREVRSLTDKAFRSLCIGDEAVYNDSDLVPSSPCIHRDRQRAFSQSGLEREDGDRNDLKKAIQDSFSLMVQQYEQDLIHEGMCGAERNRNPQWDVCGDRTRGSVSATFQHPSIEITPENRSLGEDPFGSFSNGATDLSLQHRRSRSRVSSLIRAFNSKDGAVMEDHLREWNAEARWNRPGLMNMLSPYQQNFTNGHLPLAGQFPFQDTNLYSTEAPAMSHMNAATTFMDLSHNNHNMTPLDCNSNFFIHSEFSPFRVWRDKNTFQQADPSKFIRCSEFPNWDQTPMYKELSLEPQMDGSSFQERIKKHHRTMTAPVAADHLLQSISTSTRLQKTSALEKRCESEQAVHYPDRIGTQSLGTKRFPSRRPSTASPIIEMSSNVQETISSVNALHQQIKIMTEQNTKPEMRADRHGALCSNHTLFAITTEGNVANHGTAILSNDAQLLSSLVSVSQAELPESTEDAVSPQPVEHPPVRAESRGGTPDVRMSSYKSRASGLLFNLKDNRKRVKSTYSPTKFKGFEPLEKNRAPPLHESKDIVIDIPEYLLTEIQESIWTDAAPHQHGKPYHSPKPLSPGMNSQPNTGDLSDDKIALKHGETVQISGYIPENYTSNHLITGQNISEDMSSFPAFKQDVAGIQVGGEEYTHESSYNDTDMHWATGENSQIRDYLTGKGAHLKEEDERHSIEEPQRSQIKQNYSNVLKERWRPTNTPNTKRLALKTVVTPWKQESSLFNEKHQHAQANLQAITTKEISSPRDDHKKESQQDTNKEAQRTPQCNLSLPNPTFCGQDSIKNYFQENKYENGNKNTDKTMHNQDASQRKECAALSKEEQPKATEQQNTSNNHNSSSIPEMEERVHQVKYSQPVEVKALQNTSKQIQPEQRQMQQSNIQQWQTGTIEADTARSEKTDGTMADKVKPEQDQAKEQMREKLKERTDEKLLKVPTQAREDKETNDVFTEPLKGVQSKQVQAEQTDLEGLKAKQRQFESVKTQPSEKDKIKIDEVEAVPKTIEQGEKEMLEDFKMNNVKSEQTTAKHLIMEKAQLQTKKEHASAGMEVHSEKHKHNEKKAEKESQVNAQTKKEIHDAKKTNPVDRKADLARMDLNNIELAKVVQAQHQHIKERSSKPTTILTRQQKVKSEPSKVKRVKTELANAKVELAKIKEKMKEDQRDKFRYATVTKEKGGANKDGPAEVAVQQQQTAQTHQPKDNSAAEIAHNVLPEDHGADCHQSLREKYGFTNSLSHKMSPEKNIPLNNDNYVTPSALSLDIFTKVKTNKSNDDDPTISGETNNKEKGKFNQEKESLYIYSESSKDFKLSQADYLPDCAEKTATGDIVIGIGKKDKVKKLETSFPDSHPDNGHSESVRNPETKYKSEGLKTSGHKVKAQTKQEILTSKVKAHAEKEISALMEGYALREVFTSKSITKPLPARHNLNLKQIPQSHEVLRGHEISISHNTTATQQTGPLVMEDKALPSSEGTSTQAVNQWHKQLPTEPMKSNSRAPEDAPTEMKNTPSYSVSTEQQPDHHEIRSPITNMAQESKYSKEKLVVKPDEISEELKLEESTMHKSDAPVDKMKSLETTSQQGVVHKDFVFEPTNSSVAEDSLQIMGIIVTEIVNNDHKVLNSEESKESRAEPDTSFLSPSTEMSKKSECLIRIGTTHATENESPAKVGMNINHEETKDKSVTVNESEKTAPLLQQCSNIKVGPQSNTQVKGKVAGINSINKAAAETQLLHYKQHITAAEMNAGCTLETSDPAKNCNKEDTQTEEINPSLIEIAGKVINSGPNYTKDSDKLVAKTQSVTSSLEEDVASPITSENSELEDKYAPLLVESKNDSTIPHLIKTESMNASTNHKETNMGIMNQMEDVHIDNIFIRVVAAREMDSVEKLQSTTCSDVALVPFEEHQYEGTACASKNMSESIKDYKDDYPASKSCEEQKTEMLEDKLSVQDVLASVRKLADSMKIMDPHKSINPAREERATDIQQSHGTPSNLQASEGEYFQVEGIPEVPLKNNNTQSDVSDISKEAEHSAQPADHSKVESSTISVQDERERKHTRGGIDKNSLKETDHPSELQNCEKIVAAQTTDMSKQHSEFRLSLSGRDRHHSRNSQPTREEPKVKSKPKDKVSTIPEISALADYARLKVIVSEDRENTIQEFPPHKKEGFFPLIQSRHSRRPLFFADPQTHAVNKKSVPKKTEVDAKVNKEPKSVVFPITEKEYQRTGMFKLGEKEKREKTSFDVKDHEQLLKKQLQDFTQRKPTHKLDVKNVVHRKEVPRIGQQIVSQQSNNLIQAPKSSSSISKSRDSTQSQQQILLDTANTNKTILGLTTINSPVHMDKDSYDKRTVEPFHKDDTSKMRNIIKTDTTAERGSEKSRKEKLETDQEDTNADLEASANNQQEGASRRKEETITDDMIARIEERRAFISEERKHAQREAARWEKLKETAQRMEEERKAKEIEVRETKQTNDERRIEKEGENRQKVQEERGGSVSVGERARLDQRREGGTAQEQEQMRAVLTEEQRLPKRTEERRFGEESRIKKIQENRIEEHQSENQKRGEQMTHEKTETNRAAEKHVRGEQPTKGERVSVCEELNRNLAAQRVKASTDDEQKRASLLMDALQYYTITSTDEKPKERQERTLQPFQQRNNRSEVKQSEDTGSHTRLHRPQDLPSPAPSLPRSSTSSPALGGKPLMFRVKDNTKGSSFTKSVKPRFHKNFAEESRVASQIDWRAEKKEDQQEITRANTGTPANPDITGSNRLAPTNKSSVSQPVYSARDYSDPLSHHRPLSRRIIAMDDDDTRSLVSNMSEEVQSFATAAVDMADLRGLHHHERPISACSFSSDISCLGKPPAVPPKSDKALRRAQRLSTRRIRKEVTQSGATNPAETPQQEASSRLAAAPTEVWSSNRHAVASPHFSPPVSLTHAPTFGASLRATPTEKHHSRLTSHPSPHASALAPSPVTSPHDIAPVSNLDCTAPMSNPSASACPAPASHPVIFAHTTTPVSLLSASSPITAPALDSTPSPHPTTSVLHPVTFLHTTTPVSLQSASSPHVTPPTTHPVVSPHSTVSLMHPVTPPHIPPLSSQPVTIPHAMAQVTHTAPSPHSLAPVNPPPTTLHVATAVSHPVALPYIPALVSHPAATPHAIAPISLPMSSAHASAQITYPSAPKMVQHVPSSPTLHYATHSAPVTQYHVESSYPQSYPLTQRKVLQDLGSGQYFLLEAPIEVKTKTFLDPETGKYVQINVRESNQSIFQPHLQSVLTQPLFPQVNFQPQLQLKQRHELLCHGSPAEKPFTLYKGYQDYPQIHNPSGILLMPSQTPSSGVSIQKEPFFKNNCNTNQSNEIGQKFVGQRYSPEQTPYMDTVNDTNKTQNTVYDTHESLPECGTNQVPGSLCENENSARSRCRTSDIMTMSQLDDFMEMTDW